MTISGSDSPITAIMKARTVPRAAPPLVCVCLGSYGLRKPLQPSFG